MRTNQTHDPTLRSWVESANGPASDFPIQNLPLAVVTVEHEHYPIPTLATIIGDQVVNIALLAEAGLFDGDLDEYGVEWLHSFTWNRPVSDISNMTMLRAALQRFLRADGPTGQQARRLRHKALSPLANARFLAPIHVPNYTDFYASRHHARTVGSMFRPDNPLLPNYAHVPIAYHGRASTLVVGGSSIRRPHGQTKPDDADSPSFGPTAMLDYELELGAVIGWENDMGSPIPADEAGLHVAGLCLVNDWSARDIQKWEYQPLGPFLAKNFATSFGPLVVTAEALAPFRVPGPPRDPGDPEPLPYLRGGEHWGLDIQLEVLLASEQMRERSMPPVSLSRGRFRDMYWTVAQMIAHHTSNGCALEAGDILASGTISGPEPGSSGCLLELTWRGIDPDTRKPRARAPISLPTGETRTFLADGDEVIMRAWCEREGFRRLGFGECRGIIRPALSPAPGAESPHGK